MTFPMMSLGDVCSLITDGSHFSPPTVADGVPYVTVRDLSQGRINFDTSARISKQSFSILEANGSRPMRGDVLFSKDGTIGRIATVPDDRPFVVLSSLAILRPSDEAILPNFLALALTSPALQAQVMAVRSGTALRRIILRNIRPLKIPVPPLDEQRRIVDLLEDHLSRLDAAESLVATSLRRLMSFRRSVLAELHDGDPTTLGELAVDSGYGTSEKCVPGGPGPAVVRIPNLVDGRIDLSDEKRIASDSVDVERYVLGPGDLLIVRTNGSVDLIGRSAVVQDGVDAAFASYLIRYQLRPDRVIPEWVQAMLSTPQIRFQIEKLAASR